MSALYRPFGHQALEPDLLGHLELHRAHAGGPHRGADAGDLDDVELADVEAGGLGPQAGHLEQRRGLVGHRAVAVLPLGPDVVDLGLGGDRGQAPVGLEPQLLLLDVGLGQVGVERQVELDLGRLAHLLALQLGHDLADHLAVQVVADRGDVARLAGAEQVAGAPDLEVAHGDLEPRAQLGGLADGLEPLVGLFGQRAVAGVEQVGVGPLARPPDPAPDLVELAQARAGRPGRPPACSRWACRCPTR